MNKKSSLKQKHVIILGAGASCTSGYPLANKLRLLLSCEKKTKEELRGQLSDTDLERCVFPMFRGPFEETTALFRNGGFATIDEFSWLAGSRFPKEVQDLKRRVRFALALHNPETAFQNSDYYPFIQKLFQKGIFPLRNDISVLTFNYDPYLPFLLKRAVEVRHKAAGQTNIGSLGHGLTSGFEGRAVGGLEDGNEFCLLQLHGMIAWPKRFDDERVLDFRDLFYKDTKERLQSAHTDTIPPIVFPWEVIDEKGKFRSKLEFCLNEACDTGGRRQGGYTGDNDLFTLFTSIWKRARKEIENATKISFVGLSMHEFLNPAFQFLFHGKKGEAKILVANKDLENFRGPGQASENYRSPAAAVRRLLKQVWVKYDGRLCSDGMVPVATRETFGEFIQRDMH